VAAFKSTLEEVALADLVLHVADAATPDLRPQIEAVRDVLGEIGAGDLPEVLVLNKWDLVGEEEADRLRARFPDAVPVSALTGEGVEAVLAAVARAIPRPPVDATLLVPFDRADVLAWLHREADVSAVATETEGTKVRARLTAAQSARVREFVLNGRDGA
jgi:GTP-binding protein HflX